MIPTLLKKKLVMRLISLKIKSLNLRYFRMRKKKTKRRRRKSIYYLLDSYHYLPSDIVDIESNINSIIYNQIISYQSHPSIPNFFSINYSSLPCKYITYLEFKHIIKLNTKRHINNIFKATTYIKYPVKPTINA